MRLQDIFIKEEEYQDEELTEYDKLQFKMHDELEAVDTEKLDYCYQTVLRILPLDEEDTIHGLEAEGKILMQKTCQEFVHIFAKYHGLDSYHEALAYAHMRYPKMTKAFGKSTASYHVIKKSGGSFKDLQCPYDGVEIAARGCEHAFADAVKEQLVGLGR